MLLNKYINVLSKSEQAMQLIFDKQWMGAEAVYTVFNFLCLIRSYSKCGCNLQNEAQLEEEKCGTQEEMQHCKEEEHLCTAQWEQEWREKEELKHTLCDEAKHLECKKRNRLPGRSMGGVQGICGH
jgi:DASH complex subunit Duo1